MSKLLGASAAQARVRIIYVSLSLLLTWICYLYLFPTPIETSSLDDVMLMVKSGGVTLFDRVPMQLHTFVPLFKHRQIYSDSPAMILGHTVHDCLAPSQSMPDALYASHDFEAYRQIQILNREQPFTQLTPRLVKEGWALDRFKNVQMLLDVWRRDSTRKWYFMIDDDTFVFAHALDMFLKTLGDPMTERIYTGSAANGLEAIFAHGGSGILISHAAMHRAFDQPDIDQRVKNFTQRAQRECCGDYMVALFLKDAGIDLDYGSASGRFQSESFYNLESDTQNWCKEIVTLHHVRPKDIELTRRLKTPTHRDIFMQFISTHIAEEKTAWDNGAKEHESCYTCDLAHRPIEFQAHAPYASLTNCRRVCESDHQCVMYRYDPYKLYCGWSSRVALGQLPNYSDDASTEQTRKTHGMPPDRTESQHIISRWILHRVSKLRAISC